MSAKRPLKVFRTSIGFGDAYIAVPSQKAALEAWGANSNLFARGMAEIVSDPALTEAALENPGKVVRVSRGTTADHLAAAKPVEGARRTESDGSNPTAQPKPKPRPSRRKLDDARAALGQQRDELDAKRADIDAQIDALRAERTRIKAEHDAEIARLNKNVGREDEAYRQALRHWQAM